MANWKKVVVSGSSAQLSSLTLDTFLESGSGGTGLTSTSLLAAATGTVLTKGAFGLGLTALPEPIEIPAGTVSSSAQTIANLSGTGIISGSVQVVGSTFTSGETITQFSSSAATRISTLENASSTAPAGTISSSATGTAQGTIALNGVDVNIKDMQAASSPTFVGLTLTTGDAIFGGNLTVQGTASFENTENLQIKDRFISLASGSAGPADGGIVIEQSNVGGGKGAVFAYDGLSTGRWGIDTAFNPTSSTYTPAAFMSAVVEGGSGVDTPSAVGSDYVQKGNIFVGNNEDIYIYS